MAIDQEMLNMIDAEKTRVARAAAEAKAKAASGGNGAGFFMLKDGELAKVRPLFNKFIPVYRHDFYNRATNKYEVQAVCAQSIATPVEFCVHCQKAIETKNRKLEAVMQFVVPLWLYGIRDTNDLIPDGYGNKVGRPRTYQKEGEEPQLVRGLRYAQFKPGDPIFENLLTMYKMAGDITLRDISIKQTGSKLEKEFTIDPLDPTPFAIEGLPVFTKDSIVNWVAEKNPPALIDQPGSDPFGPSSSTTTAQPGNPSKYDF